MLPNQSENIQVYYDSMREAGVKLTIVSNGAEKRVRPFAEKLGLAYLYRAAKPLPFALMVAQHRMGVKHRQMAMVGDQLYADRMVAALYGISRSYVSRIEKKALGKLEEALRGRI